LVCFIGFGSSSVISNFTEKVVWVLCINSNRGCLEISNDRCVVRGKFRIPFLTSKTGLVTNNP